MGVGNSDRSSKKIIAHPKGAKGATLEGWAIVVSGLPPTKDISLFSVLGRVVMQIWARLSLVGSVGRGCGRD